MSKFKSVLFLIICNVLVLSSALAERKARTRKGESLTEFSVRTMGSADYVQKIMEMNKIKSAAQVRPGTWLMVPNKLSEAPKETAEITALPQNTIAKIEKVEPKKVETNTRSITSIENNPVDAAPEWELPAL